MKIHSIKRNDLVYFGERIEPYFASSIIIRGMLNATNIKMVLGWNNGVRWMYANNYFFINKKDLHKANTTIQNTIHSRNGHTYIAGLVRICIEYGNQLLKTSRKIGQQTNKKHLDRLEMHTLLNAYLSEASKYMIFQNIALFEDAISDLADQLVKKYGNNQKEQTELLDLITTSNRLTAGEREKSELLNLAVKNSATAINEHVRKYGWLALRFFVGKPWTEKTVLARLKKYTPTKAKLEIERIVATRKTRELTINEAAQNFSAKDRTSIDLIRSIVFLRTQRTDYFQESSYYVLPLIKKIAAELNTAYDDLLYLSAQEVLLSLENTFDYSNIIAKRKKGFVVYFDYQKDEILESGDALRYIQQRSLLQQGNINTNTIRGKAGYFGKAVGKVKI